MPTTRKRVKRDPMVPIRVDRLRAGQRLGGRSWPDIARELGTTHPRLFHLTHGEGTNQRRCRRSVRDGLARTLRLDLSWLAGDTPGLHYVLSEDASIVDLSPGHNWAAPRWSLWAGSAGSSPELQLALERLVVRADAALRRDLARAFKDDYVPRPDDPLSDDIRACGLMLVIQSVEIGLDLIQPIPLGEQASALRLSGVQHLTAILEPWLAGKRAYPDWRSLHAQIGTRYGPPRKHAGLGVFDVPDVRIVLFDTYDRLAGQ